MPELRERFHQRCAILTLSATIGPLVALVSAAICNPSKSVSLARHGTREFGSISEPYHNALIVDASHNCCTSAGGFGKGNTPGVESRVAVVVGEVEARHRDNGDVHGQSVNEEIRRAQGDAFRAGGGERSSVSKVEMRKQADGEVRSSCLE